MGTDVDRTRPAFHWNAGGWFGSQLGCTLWMLILGLVLMSRDAIAAWVCIAGFALLNLWGFYLWRSRARLSAYAGIQWFLLVTSAVVAVAVLVVNIRGMSQPPGPGALTSTYLPYWVMAVPPGLMLFFLLLARSVKRSQG